MSNESKDPALDAVKHLFGLDKNKHQENHQEPQPAPADSNLVYDAPAQVGSDFTPPESAQAAPNYTQPEPAQAAPSYSQPEQPVQSAPHATAPFEAATAAPAPATGGDVEQINGHAVGFAFLRYYREHPEIGQPVGEQQGDVGGYQMFENGILHWDGSQIQVEWREGHNPQAASTGSSAGSRTYTVQSGDNLSSIAQKFYGDANQWQRIFEANRKLISDPDLIYSGQELVIP